METATVAAIKKELSYYSQNDLLNVCLRLAKFKKENKELLTYLLFDAENEQAYINSVKRDIDEAFAAINTKNYNYIKKGVRKTLTSVKKYIRYSQNKETEVILLLYFCRKLRTMKPSFTRNSVLRNTYQTQLRLINNALEKLHEDLQHDYLIEIDKLTS